MSQESSTYFSTLVQELGQRAARSLISKFSPVSNPLRAHLHEKFECQPGDSGSFLADPVFEASFGWDQAPQSMQDLSGNLLHPRLVEAMDAPPEDLKEQRFASQWHPYSHQVTSWKELAQNPPRSIIVSSGTGSGKTECFLIPILNDLATQLDQKNHLEGVQALLLYPLNALINSQRDRLRAWTSKFNGSIRFALFNGETLEDVPAAVQRATPEVVLSRKSLRASPPPILVTNSTMLEYMLVRQQDHPILEKSKGMLRWIVLDEAHTYIGSHAAEISLLLRRVLHAFGVEAQDVHFIATSATIGSADDEKAKTQLQRYLADIAGIDPSRVTVVQGLRDVPSLPREFVKTSKQLPRFLEMRDLPPEELFKTLAANENLRKVRQSLIDSGPRTLTELTTTFTGKAIASSAEKQETLELIDLCRTATFEDNALLPLRGHLFHRTQSGLWACCNHACSGRANSPLDSAEWPFGKIFLERREICDEPGCRSKVFELIFCDSCGAEYLAAEEQILDEQSFLTQRNFEGDDENTEEETLIEEEVTEEPTEDVPCGSFPRFITDVKFADVASKIDRISGLIDTDGETAVAVGLIYPHEGFRCCRCGVHEKRSGQIFRPARSGAAFHLLMSIPTLLEHTPPVSDNASHLPFGGRRLITFSDSRQGTARFSLQAQIDAERNYARSWLYHQVSANKVQIDESVIEKKKITIAALEQAVQAAPETVLQDLLKTQHAELATLLTPPASRLSWEQAVQQLKDTRVLQEWLPEHWKHTGLGHLSSIEIAKLCLIREFARRPKRQTSLETLGLVSLNYPAIERITEANLPSLWRQRSLGVQEWRDFLKIAVDFVIRGSCAVQVPAEHSRWIGIELPRRFIVEPDATVTAKWIIRWPLVRGGVPRSRLPILLFRALGLSPEEYADRADVNELLQAAWQQIRTLLLTPEQDGYRLNLENHVEFRTIQDGWLCPITRSILDVTLKGYSPYLTLDMPEAQTKCTRIKLPNLLYPFGRDKDAKVVSREQILGWLNTDKNIESLRKDGVWSSYSDRISLFSPFYRINEHSAQQNSDRLRKLEAGFKLARINILSCSTTMEMGVDIGGVSSVAMNNAPPSPANYLQRAGRAGRRKESAAVCFTLCQSSPHGEAVFMNPAWPFRTKITLPNVSLQSDRIIQRHINALVLTRFLQLHAQDLTKLQCGWFFLPPSEDTLAPASMMELWVLKHDERAIDTWLIGGIKRLTKRTSLEGVEPFRLLDQVGIELKKVRDHWSEEEVALEQELALAGGVPQQRENTSPAQMAIHKQMQRMQHEYLLGELASNGFLPGYGFPTSVVQFVNSTLEDLRRDQGSKKEREDNPMRRRGFPSRDLPIAIRDYAPGTDVVIDGQVFTSEGVTLNWHIPVGDYTAAPELQSFKNAWRCRGCGSSGTRATLPHGCPVCGTVQANLLIRPYLQPAGFAVSIYEKPHNDLSFRNYIPIHKPWITAGQTPWAPLPRPELGRYRFSHDGHIFYQSGGVAGQGYAICLRCGRSASEHGEGAPIPSQLEQHLRLRGGKEPNGQTLCQGNDQQWAIKRHQWLGVGVSTDVFELQLVNPITGTPLNDDTAAYSLAVALRQALAEELGINDREISCSSIPSRTSTNQVTRSIVLYDTSTGGAGFVSSAASLLPRLLQRAKELLNCKKGCDTACSSCLLTYDTQHEVKRLNRHKAISIVTNQLIDGLQLPQELLFFGPDTRLEFDELQFALFRELQRTDISDLRIYLGGEASQWDVLDWPLRSSILKWAGEGRKVTLIVPMDLLSSLDAAVVNPLASLIEAGGIDLQVVAGNEVNQEVQTLIAEAGGAQRSVRWASTSKESLTPAENWGRGLPDDRCVRIVKSCPLSPLNGDPKASSTIRRTPPGTYRELVVAYELDGPINQLGTRFWKLVSEQVPQLKERLDKKVQIASVNFRDRYLSSPMNVRLLYEVLKGLTTFSGHLGVDTPVTLETVDSVKQSYKWPDMLHMDWQQRDQRNVVIQSLLKGIGETITLRGLPQRQTQHARDLTITWKDGARWTIRLDHGLTFLRSGTMMPFEFSDSSQEQMAKLNALQFNVKNSLGSQGTYFYLTDVTK